MSVILYRPNESTMIEPEMLEMHLQAGWYLSREEAVASVVEPEPEPEPEVSTLGMSNKEIRDTASFMGHDKPDTARIDTLKRFIENGGNS